MRRNFISTMCNSSFWTQRHERNLLVAAMTGGVRRAQKRNFDRHCNYSTPQNLSNSSSSTLQQPIHSGKAITHLKGKELALQLHGKVLSNPKVCWEQWGDPALPDDRTILIFPGLSHSSHAAANLDDPRPGWWNDMIGPGKFIDTTSFRVICISSIGSPFGSTSPIELNEQTSREYKADFPQITTMDIARCNAMLLEELNIGKVHAIIGASFGGMVALQFASLFPELLSRLVTISSTAKSTPGSCAYRRVQRRAILGDKKYKDGYYDENDGPISGLMIARELGLALYRSRHELDSMFEWDIVGESPKFDEITFEVESWLHYEAESFSSWFDANSYLLLSRAADLQDMGMGRRAALSRGMAAIKAKTLVIGVSSDDFIPASEQKHVADSINSHGGHAELQLLDIPQGHHAVFSPRMQQSEFGPRIREFLTEGLTQQLEKERYRYSDL